MKKKSIISLTIISILFGFILVLQIKTTNQPEIKETRDVWKLREEYLAAKEMEAHLLQDIRKAEEKIAQYEQARIHSREQVLNDTLEELRTEAGLKELTGPGIVITLRAANTEIYPNLARPYLSSTILRKMINELNMHGAEAISIAERRVIQTTVIREIQGETKIDGYPLKKFPIEIKVLAENKEEAKKLYNMMQISSIPDDFFVDNILLEISEPQEEITIPPYDGEIRVEVMESIGEGADS